MTDSREWHPRDHEFDDIEEWQPEYQDCGLMPNGQCMKAGTEECDWDCGALDVLYAEAEQ